MIHIRRMAVTDEPSVHDVYRVCHPGWPDRGCHWYFVNPTFVAVYGARVVGFASFSINTGPGVVLAQGQDCCVLPSYRRTGLARRLHAARVAVAREVGATVFSGATQPDNLAMQRIFTSVGLHHCQTIPGYYPDGVDALLYLGPIVR